MVTEMCYSRRRHKPIVNQEITGVRMRVLKHLDGIAKYCGSDIFLLKLKTVRSRQASASYANGSDQRFDQRLRIAIYGDPESSEHAKMRVLIMIDQNSKFPATPALVIARTNCSIAQTHCGSYEARAFVTPCHMWPDAQKYPT